MIWKHVQIQNNSLGQAMSKHETPLTRWYWQQVGGTLIEEFVAVKRTSKCGVRVLDGVIIKDGDFRIAKQSDISLEGKDVIVIQTKSEPSGDVSDGTGVLLGAVNPPIQPPFSHVCRTMQPRRF